MSEKMMYQNLYYNLKNIVNYLNNAITNVSRAISNSNSGIVINGVCYKSRELNTIRNNLEQYRRTIVNVYLPDIKSRIEGLE